MSGRRHHYRARIVWTGNRGNGTNDYRSYGRGHAFSVEGKPTFPLSSDAAFRGDADRHTPEDMLLGALTSCHMLWYLHLAADAGVVVLAYKDEARAEMTEGAGAKGGRFLSAVLSPRVTISSDSDPLKARELHAAANRACFVANSVNFPVTHEPVIIVAD